MEQLAKHLHQLGIPTPNGKSHWSLTTLRDVLRNPVYAGTVYAGRERVVEKHRRFSPLQLIGRRSSTQETPSDEWIVVGQVPAIVSQEQFDRVQAKLADNVHFARRNNTSHQYLLRALVSCGLCHLSCLARMSSRHAYYVCRGKQGPIRSRREECCHSRYIPAGQLDTLVWQDLCEVLPHPIVIEQALQRAQAGAWLPQELQARRTQVRKAHGTLCGQLERLTEAYLADAFPLGEYKRRRQDVEQRLAAVEAQANQIETSIQQHMELIPITDSINEFCQRIGCGLSRASFEQKRQLVELLVDRVVVTMDEVEIRYVIPTSPRSERIRFCHLLTDYFMTANVTCIFVPLIPSERKYVSRLPLMTRTFAQPLQCGVWQGFVPGIAISAWCLKNLSRSRKPGFLRALAEINQRKSGTLFLLILVSRRSAYFHTRMYKLLS